ncbi:UNVERIFIED_CONTAM: Ca-activated chloride channel family protein [Acetivibrio alkalicellulosi]
MSQNNNSFKILATLFGISLLVFGVIYGGITLTGKLGNNTETMSTERAISRLDRLCKNITINTVEPRKEHINIDPVNLMDTLPDISKYPIQVKNTTTTYIEIFSSPEKAGDGKDGWLVEMAKAFNNSNIVINASNVSVKIRSISSGEGMDYIVSGKYLPDAFTPSNELWGEMLKSKDANITLIEKRLVGNIAGVLLSKRKHKQLTDKYGDINIRTITEAVAENELDMGYTNPFASSTGLNYLLSTLSTFDQSDILSEKAIQGFEKFQLNIPFVSYTTLQMRESARSGILDGFILEYQTFVNSPELKRDYIFTPFGVRHDSPMYAIGNLSYEKQEILAAFIEFCKSNENQKTASEYGFNSFDDYSPEFEYFDGDSISQAQRLWKEKKDSNYDIVAVFVADVSGSMMGEPLNMLKESLLSASKFIKSDTSIGLVSFGTNVTINLPIAKFDLNQRSLFTGAVKDLTLDGNTAMFDGIIVALRMLLEEKEKNPNAKLMLFVLGDGEPNYGHKFNDVSGLLKSLRIPVYTIGYNANIDELERLSLINEAAFINADTEDVAYKLGSLFNAQM